MENIGLSPFDPWNMYCSWRNMRILDLEIKGTADGIADLRRSLKLLENCFSCIYVYIYTDKIVISEPCIFNTLFTIITCCVTCWSRLFEPILMNSHRIGLLKKLSHSKEL